RLIPVRKNCSATVPFGCKKCSQLSVAQQHHDRLEERAGGRLHWLARHGLWWSDRWRSKASVLFRHHRRVVPSAQLISSKKDGHLVLAILARRHLQLRYTS